MASTLTELFTRTFPRSAELADAARLTFPSGVTHDGRYLEPFPVFIDHATGATKTTVEGRSILDYWVGHGSLILGHSHPAIVAAVQTQMARGTHYAANHELELAWAHEVQRLVPSAERVRFTSSGTEATLMACRIARMVTGRPKVMKLTGHFHGWHDFLVPTAYAPYGGPDPATPGIAPGVLADVVSIPPHDLDRLEQGLRDHQPACLIIEGTGGHWGQVPITGAYLRAARELARRHDVLFILDEVITGFRVAPGGAQQVYDLRPDLTTLAKILAGGLPGGALVGREDLLEAVAFNNRYGRKMPHPGTYNGNPLSAAAGVAALQLVATGTPCETANRLAARLRRGINRVFREQRVPWVAYGEFSFIHILPDYDGPAPEGDDFLPYGGDYLKLDGPRSAKLKHAFRAALLIHGVDWFSWGGMTSAAHTDADIDRTIEAFGQAVELLRADGFINPAAG